MVLLLYLLQCQEKEVSANTVTNSFLENNVKADGIRSYLLNVSAR